MRKSLLALVFTAALPTIALAGPMSEGCPFDGANYKEHAEIPHGLKSLDLTPEQLKAISKAADEQRDTKKDILTRYLEKLSADDKAALQKDLLANKAARDKTIRQVLTPEQLKKFEEKKEKAKAMHAEWEEFQKWKAEKEKAAAAKPAAPAAATPAAPAPAEKAPEKK